MEIIAKRFSRENIPERVNWINDPRINYTMFFDLPASIENTQNWYDKNVGSSNRIDFTFYCENTNKILAMGGFTGISNEHKNAEFYVMVNPDMHGKGIGKYVSFWMYNYAFSVLKLNKIYLYTNDDNIAAFSIYEKAGFQLEGILRCHKWKNNDFQNRRFYGLLQSEWENLNWKKEIADDI